MFHVCLSELFIYVDMILTKLYFHTKTDVETSSGSTLLILN